MLILVYGEDGFRVKLKVAQLRDSFVKKFPEANTNVSRFSASSPAGEILSAVRSGGLLSPKRFVEIEGLVSTLKAGDVATWEKALVATDADAIIVLSDTLSAKEYEKQPLAKGLVSASDRHEYVFETLSPKDAERWVVHELAERGATIQSAALRDLLANVGSDSWQLAQEIEKLSARAGTEMITSAMVAELVHGSFEGRIFDFLDAVSRRETKKAVALLDNERASGTEDGYLFQMLVRQVRILLGVRSLLEANPSARKDEIAAALSVHPFVAQKALEQARRFTEDELMRAHDLLFELDQETKRGMDMGLAVERVTTKLLSGTH